MPPAQRFSRNRAENQRLALVSLVGEPLTVRAQFNPHEVQVEKSITWHEHKSSGADAPDLEYTIGNPRSMTLELMFDCFEDRAASIRPALEALHQLALVANPSSAKPKDRMPPVIEVVNGPIPGFRCVIESLAIKATMFDDQMVPVRATVSLKLKEVQRGALESRRAATTDEKVMTGYQPAGAQNQAERDAAYREWEKDRFARNATEFPQVDAGADGDGDGDGAFTQAEVDRFAADKERRDQDERTQWLADNGIAPE